MKKVVDYIPEFWYGKENLLVRAWTYLHRGLDFVNQGRYLILGIISLYAVLKLTNPLYMVVMFLIAVPVLIQLGRWHLYRVSKTQEYITTTKGSVLGYQGFNISVEQVELLRKILNELENPKRRARR